MLMQKKIKDENTSWGKESSWYDKLLADPDSYQQKVVLPNLMRILDVKKGERVLDLGCGQGFFTAKMSELGAEMTGLDISSELISLAKKSAKNISYVVGRADQRLPFENNYFDKAFCILALQNMKEIAIFFEEVSRVLKEKGSLILVLNHPTFRVPQESDWGIDEKGQYRKIYKYLSEKKVEIDMHPGKTEKIGKKSSTVSFHRPLQLYFKNFAKNGFAVTRLEEWISHKESQKGPKKIQEDNARKEIPLFMMIEVKRL